MTPDLPPGVPAPPEFENSARARVLPLLQSLSSDCSYHGAWSRKILRELGHAANFPAPHEPARFTDCPSFCTETIAHLAKIIRKHAPLTLEQVAAEINQRPMTADEAAASDKAIEDMMQPLGAGVGEGSIMVKVWYRLPLQFEVYSSDDDIAAYETEGWKLITIANVPDGWTPPQPPPQPEPVAREWDVLEQDLHAHFDAAAQIGEIGDEEYIKGVISNVIADHRVREVAGASGWRSMESAPRDEECWFLIRPKVLGDANVFADTSGNPILLDPQPPRAALLNFGRWSALMTAIGWAPKCHPPIPRPPAPEQS